MSDLLWIIHSCVVISVSNSTYHVLDRERQLGFSLSALMPPVREDAPVSPVPILQPV